MKNHKISIILSFMILVKSFSLQSQIIIASDYGTGNIYQVDIKDKTKKVMFPNIKSIDIGIGDSGKIYFTQDAYSISIFNPKTDKIENTIDFELEDCFFEFNKIKDKMVIWNARTHLNDDRSTAVIFFDIKTNTVIRHIPIDIDILDIEFSPINDDIYISCSDNKIYIMETTNYNIYNEIDLNDRALFLIGKTGINRIYAAKNNGELGIIDVEKQKEVKIVQLEPKDALNSMAISPDGKKLAVSVLFGNRIHIFDIFTESAETTIDYMFGSTIFDITFYDNNTIYANSKNHLHTFNVTDKKHIDSFFVCDGMLWDFVMLSN